MYTLIAQNKYGQQLELTHNEAYVIESIEGLDPPDAVINTTRNANADGSVFNSSYVDNRTIIITLAINGPAEDNRINLYKYFKNKYPVRLFYKNNTRNVYIDGYCKNIQIEFFNQKQIAQITIICPEPFFNGSEKEIIDFSSVNPLFEFPFEVPYSKNLLLYPYDNDTKTINGVTFTNNNDGSITINGTATAYSSYNIQGRLDSNTPFYLSNGVYTVSGCPEGGSNSTYRMIVGITENNAWKTIGTDLGDGGAFEYDTSMGDIAIAISVASGATVNNLTFKPMIQLAELGNNLLIQPYYSSSGTSNGITFTVNNDGTVKVSGTSTSSGYTYFNFTRRNQQKMLGLVAGDVIAIKGGVSSECNIGLGFYDDNEAQTGTSIYDNGYGETVIVPEDTTGLEFIIRVAAGATVDTVITPVLAKIINLADEWSAYTAPAIEFSEIVIEQERDIINSGDVESGVNIYLRARGPLTNPTIYNVETNEYFKLTLTMVKGDEVYINTKKKQKTVQLTSNGVTTNIIGQLVSGSTWFTLNPGDNLFMITADTNPENLDAYCVLTDQFEGV